MHRHMFSKWWALFSVIPGPFYLTILEWYCLIVIKCILTAFYLFERSSLFCVKISFCSGHYNVNESLVKQSPKILMSCFKSKTGRGLTLTSTGPGPGYYNPKGHTEAQKKPLIRWVLTNLMFLLEGGSGEGPEPGEKKKGCHSLADRGRVALLGPLLTHSRCSRNTCWIRSIFFCMCVCLRCCTQAFFSCGKRGLLFLAVHGLLTAVASLVVEHGL